MGTQIQTFQLFQDIHSAIKDWLQSEYIEPLIDFVAILEGNICHHKWKVSFISGKYDSNSLLLEGFLMRTDLSQPENVLYETRLDNCKWENGPYRLESARDYTQCSNILEIRVDSISKKPCIF